MLGRNFNLNHPVVLRDALWRGPMALAPFILPRRGFSQRQFQQRIDRQRIFQSEHWAGESCGFLATGAKRALVISKKQGYSTELGASFAP
jgi:hypothetical protein